MSLKVLARVAPELTDESLGTITVGMVTEGDMTSARLGHLVREGILSTWPPAVAEAATDVPAPVAAPTLVGLADIDQSCREACLRAVYDSYSNHRRRSLPALSRITGLTPPAVMELIEENTDFRVSTGRDSGETYVSVRGLNR